MLLPLICTICRHHGLGPLSKSLRGNDFEMGPLFFFLAKSRVSPFFAFPACGGGGAVLAWCCCCYYTLQKCAIPLRVLLVVSKPHFLFACLTPTTPSSPPTQHPHRPLQTYTHPAHTMSGDLQQRFEEAAKVMCREEGGGEGGREDGGG